MGGVLGSAHSDSCLVLPDEVAGEHGASISECVYICVLTVRGLWEKKEDE